ncbi:MAG: hypothetical protein CM1200mP2_21420 [Planctomycetaceae bacterium]|nr:MAG: hypothetical protein CM1200mP2_21420 [Planctomycetaceae bacterium]
MVRALGKIAAKDAGSLKRLNQVLTLPRADHAERIAGLEAEQRRLVTSLRSTYLNFDTSSSSTASTACPRNFRRPIR